MKRSSFFYVSFLLLALLVAMTLPALATSSHARPQRLARGWTPLFPPLSPEPRASQAMAYDSARGVAVMYGGSDGFTHFTETWEWSSSTFTWTERQPTTVPPDRYGHAMVYDEARGVVVMFGGNGGSGEFLNDTWEYSDGEWTEVVTADAPEGRWLHAMAYDLDRQVVVLHSGQQTATAGPFGDTWELSEGNWVKQDIVNPPYPYRIGEGLAYDRRRNLMVLFGGGDSEGTDYNETWERVGTGDWQLVSPNQSPTPRYRFGIVYYGRANRTFVFGGLSGYLGDTAIYNGQTWLSTYFNPSPIGRCCTAMVYDTQRKAVFLFGGGAVFGEQNDVWYFR